MAQPGAATTPVTPSARLLSLDVVRGLTIAWMIMVNNNGGPGEWSQMDHADWNGFTATDLVFPMFLFVVGASIVLAFEARLARRVTRAQLAWQAARRAGVLFVLGVALNGFPNFELVHLRIYGVLQRIAICYLIVALFHLWDRRASSKLILVAAILLGYWVLLRWVPVPGAGMPGREIPFLDNDLNIVAWLDRHLMPGHLYEEWPLDNMRDPEGLLSTIPAIATTLIGLLAGIWMRGHAAAGRFRPLHARTQGLYSGAAICLILGYAWSLVFPLNKNLWTSSFVLVAAGWSLAIMALLFWAIEQKGWGRQGWSRALLWPWIVFGSNAITAYVISELVPPLLPDVRLPIANPGWAAFSYSVSIALLCFIPVWVLYWRKIFVKV